MIVHNLTRHVILGISVAVGLVHGVPLFGQHNAPFIFVSKLSGTLEVDRSPSTKAFKAAVGTVLKPGDVLQLTGGVAQITCSDLSLHQIQTDIPSALPCGSAVAALSYNNEEIPKTRAGVGYVPIVLSPRNTKLLSTLPLLRWRGLPDAIDYEVHVDGTTPAWSRHVSGLTSISYPADAPSLTPGTTYSFWVKKTGAADRDQTPGLGFSIATDQERIDLRTARDQVSNAAIEVSLKPLVDAAVLDSYGFHAEAIDELEKATNTKPSALAYRILSNSYYCVGLYREALSVTRKAFSLYTSADTADDSGAAWAMLQSGLLSGQLGDKAKATSDLNDAKNRFAALGLDDQVANIQRYLNTFTQ
jgi:hypothetical protein